MTVLVESPPLDPTAAINCCDRCGARAWVRVVLASGRELIFCRHHAMAHEQALEHVAVWVGDVAGDPAGSRSQQSADDRPRGDLETT